MIISLEHLALALGLAGLACLAWPVVMRLTGRATASQPGPGGSLRSPLWWVGFVLTVAAIGLLRVAQQG
jgi:hypothetical protein